MRLNKTVTCYGLMAMGMGAGMMIMSLVGTAAGIAGTYYMVKTLKDQTKTVPGS